MKKLEAVREALLKAPLGVGADKLLTFAEKGSVLSRRGMRNGAFAMSYTAHLIVTDYTGAPEALFFVVLDWLHGAEPGAAEDAIRFHVDVIDHKSVDISLTVDLEEVITPRPEQGGTRLFTVDDPDILDFREAFA